MREILVGTALGRFAMAVRNSIELAWKAYHSPESIGTLVNDQIATFLVTRLCLPGKGFVDVGAHIGSIISEVAYRDASIKLYAIEPVPEKLNRLQRRFPNIQCHACAVGESNGEIAFFINIKRPGYSSLRRSARDAEIVEITVPLRTLDSLISTSDIDVIKIDVEGAELGVLRGGNEVIARSRPLVMFESGAPVDDGLGYTKEAMWHWWHDRNFDLFFPNRVAHDAPGLTLDGFVDAHSYPRLTTNYFAIPKERRIEIRDRARNVLKIKAA
jgi:FkbM family methyltransferase